MVIDSSALISILLRESDYVSLREALAFAPKTVLSAPNWLESAIVIIKYLGHQGRADLDVLLETLGVEIYPVDVMLGQGAYDAWLRYGKGRHPAGLNFGDCFSYALAKHLNKPLLFKGDDFSKTDIVSAISRLSN
ncbi:type II toxin-antitoxin system VapC family toxin [Methylomagnum sp.]